MKMQSRDEDLEAEEVLTHLYPIGDRRPHVLVGLTCWCSPHRDPDNPKLVHHAEAD
jgi:hypothetical protein